MPLINYLVPVQFDEGAIALLPAEMDRVGIRTPLIVTDRGLVGMGLLARIFSLHSNFEPGRVFDATPQNPTEAAVEAAAAMYRARNCDGIVAIGGGSPLDLAKGAALLATHDGPLQRYAAVEGGMNRIGPRVAPVIAVPTTAGTGSEVGRAAVIVMADGHKRAVVSPHLLPRAAICDPELTWTLPAGLTAATGMDAIAHCVETFLSPADNPPADAIALDGLVRGVTHLPRACAHAPDRVARREMMMASLEGGLAFQKGLGAVHAMSHPLGALPGLTVHHGTANAVLLPAVLRFNRSVAKAKYARMCSVLGLGESGDLAEFFRAFTARLGLPRTLRELGVPRDQLGALAQAAVADFSARTNPQPATAADYLRLYEEAYD